MGDAVDGVAIHCWRLESFPTLSYASSAYYLVQNIDYTRRVEEGPEERAVGFDCRKIGFHPGLEGLVLAKRRFSHAFLPQVIPDELARVEVGRVAREEMEFQAAPLGLDEVGDQVRPAGGVDVYREEDGLPTPPEDIASPA